MTSFEKALLRQIAENPHQSYSSLSEKLGQRTHQRVMNGIRKLEERGLVKTVEEKRYHRTLSSLTHKGIAYTIRIIPELEDSFLDLVLTHTATENKFITESLAILRSGNQKTYRELVIQPLLDEINYLDLTRISEEELKKRIGEKYQNVLFQFITPNAELATKINKQTPEKLKAHFSENIPELAKAFDASQVVEKNLEQKLVSTKKISGEIASFIAKTKENKKE